jgi:hypothetical protein
MTHKERESILGIIEIIENDILHARSILKHTVSDSQRKLHKGRLMAYENCLKMLLTEFVIIEDDNADNQSKDSGKE